MLKVEFTKKFVKQAKKLTAIERKQMEKAIWNLTENPTHPSLRTKKYQSVQNIFESSINMDIRILWRYKPENRTIILLLACGHHDLL